MPAFIETQFPIARLSAESYKERKAVSGQTLTGLGKWWGRKPLILVRASILGMLMPASNNLKKDREIYLKILTMDDAGAWQRCKPAIQRTLSRAAFDAMPYAERIGHCERPENVTGPTELAWAEINGHLGTMATCLPELIEELGEESSATDPAWVTASVAAAPFRLRPPAWVARLLVLISIPSPGCSRGLV